MHDRHGCEVITKFRFDIQTYPWVLAQSETLHRASVCGLLMPNTWLYWTAGKSVEKDTWEIAESLVKSYKFPKCFLLTAPKLRHTLASALLPTSPLRVAAVGSHGTVVRVSRDTSDRQELSSLPRHLLCLRCRSGWRKHVAFAVLRCFIFIVGNA